MRPRQLGRHYIRQWREHRGLSLRGLAALLEYEPGIPLTSHANLGRIEKFQQPYSQEILEALANALQVSIRDLLEVDPTKDGDLVDMVELFGRASSEQREELRRYGRFLLSDQDSKKAS